MPVPQVPGRRPGGLRGRRPLRGWVTYAGASTAPGKPGPEGAWVARGNKSPIFAPHGASEASDTLLPNVIGRRRRPQRDGMRAERA